MDTQNNGNKEKTSFSLITCKLVIRKKLVNKKTLIKVVFIILRLSPTPTTVSLVKRQNIEMQTA